MQGTDGKDQRIAELERVQWALTGALLVVRDCIPFMRNEGNLGVQREIRAMASLTDATLDKYGNKVMLQAHERKIASRKRRIVRY